MKISLWRGGAWPMALALVSGAVTGAAPEVPTVGEFAWRGQLTLPAGASLARVDVALPALLRMQSSAAHDVRVFNAAGTVVPFAILGGAALGQAAPVVQTPGYKAYPLFAPTSAGKTPRGGMEVRLESSGQHSTAWVRMDNAEPGAGQSAPGAQPLPAALFDMRAEKQLLEALVLTLDLPHNALVPMTVSTSADLKEWTPVATKGPLFHFDGADAPTSNTLELRQPLAVQGRYLRLGWAGQTGVVVRSLSARVASVQTTPEPLRAALAPGVADGNNALKWTLPFATPIAALHLQAVPKNTLLQVRIQGRSQASLPWHTMASSVVYRLDPVGQPGSSNPATPLHGASLRALRVETSQGVAMPSDAVQATVEFAPLQVAFLASGSGPFTLAVGRPDTPPAAMDGALLSAMGPARLVDLPMASVSQMQVQEIAQGPLERMSESWLPAGVPLRSVLLWMVLGLGVLSLGAVAYSLLRQLGAKR